MSGEDEGLKKSRSFSVSYSLKIQEMKRYQPQSGTSHVKLNKTLNKARRGSDRSRGELLLKWWCCGQLSSCVHQYERTSVCVCIFLQVCFFVLLLQNEPAPAQERSTPLNDQKHTAGVCCCWKNISKHEQSECSADRNVCPVKLLNLSKNRFCVVSKT